MDCERIPNFKGVVAESFLYKVLEYKIVPLSGCKTSSLSNWMELFFLSVSICRYYLNLESLEA